MSCSAYYYYSDKKYSLCTDQVQSSFGPTTGFLPDAVLDVRRCWSFWRKGRHCIEHRKEPTKWFPSVGIKNVTIGATTYGTTDSFSTTRNKKCITQIMNNVPALSVGTVPTYEVVPRCYHRTLDSQQQPKLLNSSSDQNQSELCLWCEGAAPWRHANEKKRLWWELSIPSNKNKNAKNPRKLTHVKIWQIGTQGRFDARLAITIQLPVTVQN
jgi:hypothetical protein